MTEYVFNTPKIKAYHGIAKWSGSAVQKSQCARLHKKRLKRFCRELVQSNRWFGKYDAIQLWNDYSELMK